MKKRVVSLLLTAVLLGNISLAANAREISNEGMQGEVEKILVDENDPEEVIQEEEDAFSEPVEQQMEEQANQIPEVRYRTHVQTYGWQDWVSDGAVSGTHGQSKRLEAMELSIADASYTGSIEYRTHVQTYGWQDWVADGAVSGTSGESKRLEALQIRLTGELAEHYDVYYRVHAQTYGWLGWAKNGERAGTAGQSKRLEAMEIRLVEKGQEAPGSTESAYLAPKIQYQTHVQKYGWQKKKADGELSGTSGESKRLEAIKITLCDPESLGYSGGVEYRTHVQTYGWQNWVANGAISGTSGESKRLEAIEIRLTGELAEHYDVYYRVHCQTLGWLGWVKNGASSGTSGFSKRLESIQIQLVNKETGEVPGSTEQGYVTTIADDSVQLFGSAKLQDGSSKDLSAVGNDKMIQVDENGAILTGFGVKVANEEIAGNEAVAYRAYRKEEGWSDWKYQGEMVGIMDESDRMEAIQIKVNGTMDKLYNVYYRTRVQNYGWLAWTKNGETAGTIRSSVGIEAIQVRFVPKNKTGPSTSGKAFVENGKGILLKNPCPAAYISDEFGLRGAPTAGATTNHQGRDYAAKEGTPIYAAASGTVTKVTSTNARGKYLMIDHGNGISTLYQHCSKILVEEGTYVFVGDKIAEVGKTGIVSGAHLHFEVWENGIPVDPRLYLE